MSYHTRNLTRSKPLTPFERVNQAHKEIIDEIRQRDRNVHRLPREDMGMYIDAWADSAHPNSLGHRILAMKIREKIQEILNP